MSWLENADILGAARQEPKKIGPCRPPRVSEVREFLELGPKNLLQASGLGRAFQTLERGVFRGCPGCVPGPFSFSVIH